jgi:hypothetical protein
MALEELRVEERDRGEIASSECELRRLNPGVDGDVIHGLVQRAYDGLTPAKVHGFLPILIVREVREILRARKAA